MLLIGLLSDQIYLLGERLTNAFMSLRVDANLTLNTCLEEPVTEGPLNAVPYRGWMLLNHRQLGHHLVTGHVVDGEMPVFESLFIRLDLR